EPCTRPEGFDLAAYWEQSSADFVANLPRYPVTLRVAPDVLTHARSAVQSGRIEHISAPDVDGWVTLRIRFDIEAEAAGYVFRFGTQMEVLEPEELRTHLARTAAN